MKKAISVLLAILMLVSVFALAGCGGKDETEDATGADAATTAVKADASAPDASQPDAEPVEGGEAEPGETTTAFPDEPVVPDSLEVVEEIFDYNESHNWINYILVVKNVSDEAISVDSRSVCRDKDGNFICGNGKVNERIEVLGPGQTSFIVLQFSKYPPPPKDAKISYVLETAPAKSSYQDVLASLVGEAEVVELDGKKQVSVSVTNNGTVGTQNIFALALCYDANDEYVSFVELEHIQVGDAYGIKPGETGTQTNYNNADEKADYDHVKLFLRAESSFS